MKKNEILMLVSWVYLDIDIDEDNNTINYYDDDGLMSITVSGVGESASILVDAIGYEIITEDNDGFNMIKKYIKKQRDYKPTLCEEINMGGYKQPNNGEFVMLLELAWFKTNHPLDPEEWDFNIYNKGIIGEQIKLTY